MSDLTDEQLLNNIINGEQQSMELFYRRHSGAVYQFALKTLHNGTDASEVMNEVMMEVWSKANTITDKARVKSWLLRVTHNKAVDCVRRKARHDGNEELHEETTLAPQCSLEQVNAGMEDARNVQRCMSELKNGHRQVVYLTFFEGLA